MQGVVDHSRRSLFAGSASIALHGGLVAIALAFVGQRIARNPRSVELTMVDVIAAAPLPAAAPLAPTPSAAPAAAPTTPTKRAAAPSPRASTPRATTARSLADLQVSYDAADNFAASGETTSDGAGRGSSLAEAAAPAGQFRSALAGLEIPQPATLAHPPRPRRNYHDLRLHSVRQYAGQSIKATLTIDATGHVTHVEITRGIHPQLDQRTVNLASAFEFEPATNELGEPIPGVSRWEIKVVDDLDPTMRNALQRGYY